MKDNKWIAFISTMIVANVFVTIVLGFSYMLGLMQNLEIFLAIQFLWAFIFMFSASLKSLKNE